MPELLDCSLWLWRAWETLSAKRTNTDAGPQPISMEAFLAYAEYENISHPVRRDDLLICLTAMDAVYLDFTYKARLKAIKDAERKRKQRRR